MSVNGTVKMGKQVAGVERDSGRYYLLTVAPVPHDTRTGHTHMRGYRVVECDIHAYRAAIDTAYDSGATLDRFEVGRNHSRVYFQGKFVDMDAVRDLLVERLQIVTPPAVGDWREIAVMGVAS